MIEPLLQVQLSPLIRRHRQKRFWRAVAIGLWATIAVAFLVWWFSPTLPPRRGLIAGLILGGAAVALLVARRVAAVWSPDFRSLAREIESRHPELHALLLTAVEQQPDPATGQLNYLQKRVVREAIKESERHHWIDAVSTRQIVTMEVFGIGAAAFLAFFLFALHDGSRLSPHFARNELSRVTVTPGDTELEKGEALVIFARFAGRVPGDATLVLSATNEPERRLPLTRSLDDPVFGGSIPAVATDLNYRIEWGKQKTRAYQVHVFEYPRLERTDAHLTFPDYTALEPKTIEDTRRVTAIEGSHLGLSLQLNKPVSAARLIGKSKKVVPLQVDPTKPIAALDPVLLEKSDSYEVQLVDANGRTNKVQSQFIVEVLPNRTPELKFSMPKGDQRVSPLQEMTFQAEVSDDFGLGSYGLAYTLAGRKTQFVEFNQQSGPHEKRQFEYKLALEELGLAPDELISFYLWADDVGADGKPRRTSSDMYFAEVRPFEEIYRESQAQQDSGEQNQMQGEGNEAARLAELQKQIINATWKLQRREAAAKEVSAQYRADAPVVQDSQQKALDQVEALQERVRDGRAASALGTAEKEMQRALKQLGAATNSPAPLPEALEAEQAAYQALLKLQAREFEVAQRKKNQSGQGQNQRNQQELDQLDLTPEEDRYETQRQAPAQQTPAQREQMKALNRLKELAQRQQDLNERLKELQNALQEAKTDKQKDELRRELQRLRDEEREMLADVDQLRQQMETGQNSSNTADARKQLEKTRSEVQKASESLEKEQVSQALASGARAEQDFEQLRDDLRKKNANQFSDSLRDMRGQARDLARKQKEIGEKISTLPETTRKMLSAEGSGKELAPRFEEQKSALTNLLSQMSRVSEDAEPSEPLLAKQLYDTVRKTSQDNLEKTLGLTEQLLNQNFVAEAGKFEQRVQADMDDLKKRVEQAAETVLGDETEALRVAKRELDALSDQLEKEMVNAARSDQRGKADPSALGAGSNPAATNHQGLAANSFERGADPDAKTQASRGLGRPGGTNNPAGTQPGKPTQLAQADTGSETNPESEAARENGRSPGNQPGRPNANGQDRAQGAQDSRQSQGEQASQPGEGAQGQSGQSQAAQGTEGANGQETGKAQQGQGQGKAQQPGEGKGEGKGEGQPGQPGENEPRGREGTADQNRGQGRGEGRFFERAGTGGEERYGPLTGNDYANWSDRLGNVEELLEQPDLRRDLSRVRDRARVMRSEYKRHGKEPQWPLVKTQISDPLTEIRQHVAEELARRESQEALVPIDRDPVPSKFSELVRRYYEKLGSSE